MGYLSSLEPPARHPSAGRRRGGGNPNRAESQGPQCRDARAGAGNGAPESVSQHMC